MDASATRGAERVGSYAEWFRIVARTSADTKRAEHYFNGGFTCAVRTTTCNGTSVRASVLNDAADDFFAGSGSVAAVLVNGFRRRTRRCCTRPRGHSSATYFCNRRRWLWLWTPYAIERYILHRRLGHPKVGSISVGFARRRAQIRLPVGPDQRLGAAHQSRSSKVVPPEKKRPDCSLFFGLTIMEAMPANLN